MNVINVDIIDTVSMVVGFTVELVFKWRDHKIDYENLQNFENETGTIRIIPIKEKNEIWTPLPELVHDNAIIGETEVVDFFKLGVELQNEPLPMDGEKWKETLIYPGRENTLIVSQRMKLRYRCDFYLAYFPFDDTTCNFYISLLTIGNNSIMMTMRDDSVTYNGPKILNEFEIMEFWSKTGHYQTNTSFIYTFRFKRLYMQHLMTTFFQSFLLWILAYITLFIHVEDFSNRFVGAVTALLVLAALLSSIDDTLPKTAYFKFVDLWFNWFIANIFFIILIHIIIDYCNRKDNEKNEQEENYQNSTVKVRQVSPTPTFRKKINDKNLKKDENRRLGNTLNKFFQLTFPSLNVIFLIVYFSLTTNE